MKGTCNTCKYWEKSGEALDGFGQCSNPVNDGKVGASGAISFILLTTKPTTRENNYCDEYVKRSK